MRMNKRGSTFFGIGVGIVIFIFGVLFLPFIIDDLTTFRDAMDCSDEDITSGTMLSCLVGDAVVPYLIWFFISLSLGFIAGAKT